jgi:hypothetical protein
MELFAKYPKIETHTPQNFHNKWLRGWSCTTYITISNSIELYLSWEVMSNETDRAVPAPYVFFKRRPRIWTFFQPL